MLWKVMQRNVWSDIAGWRPRLPSNCAKLQGTILWVGKQDDSTTLQSLYSLHRWPPLQRRRNEICWRIVKSVLSNCSEMLILGSYRKTWNSMVREQICTSSHQINGPELVANVWLFWFLTFITQVNLRKKVMWEETLHNTAGWDCFRTLTLPEILKIQNRPQEEHCAYLGVTHIRSQQLEV